MTRTWWTAAGTRAVRTVAQTAVALLGTAAAGLLDVDWLSVTSGAILAGVISLLTSIGGLPEVSSEQ